MSRTPSAATDSDGFQSVVETSTAPTTPDGSLSLSPVLAATQLFDHFDGILAGTPTPTIRNVEVVLDLNEQSQVVKNICCVGAGYVGEFDPASSFYFGYREIRGPRCVAPRFPTAVSALPQQHFLIGPPLHPLHQIKMLIMGHSCRRANLGCHCVPKPRDHSKCG